MEPDLLSLIATHIVNDLNKEVIDDNYIDPQLLLDVLFKLRDAGCQLDLDDRLTPILDDYVFESEIAVEQVAFCQKALSLLKPASKQYLARQYLQATSETDGNPNRLPSSEFGVTLLTQLTREEQATVVDHALANWKSTVNSDNSGAASGQASGIALASLIRTWPEAERLPPIDDAIDHLISQSLLNSGIELRSPQ